MIRNSNIIAIVLVSVFVIVGCAHTPTTETTTPVIEQMKTPKPKPALNLVVVTIDVKRADAPTEDNTAQDFTPCNGVYVRPNLIVAVASCFVDGIYGNEVGSVIDEHFLATEENVIQVSGTSNIIKKVTFTDNGLTFIKTSGNEPHLTPLPESKPDTNKLWLAGNIRIGDSMTVSEINYPTGVTKYGYETEPIAVTGKNQVGIVGSAVVNDKGELAGIISHGNGRTLGVIPVRLVAEAAEKLE